MRSNSGKDEGRNNMRDPTMRDRTSKRTEAIGPLAHLARARRRPTTAAAARTSQALR